MIREFERAVNESEKRIFKKDIEEVKLRIPKIIRSIVVLSLALISIGVLSYYVPKVWLIVILILISVVIIWSLSHKMSDLKRLPNFIKQKQRVLETGIAQVQEIHIDRYIKINNFEDEGNYFIIEYNGMLTLIGGQEMLGVRKLKNKIEKIIILNLERTGIFYEKLKKSGESLEPYYTFKKSVSDALVAADIWENLTSLEPFKGKLEDLDRFIEADKQR